MNRTVYLNKESSELVVNLSEREGITINAAINRLICGNAEEKRGNAPKEPINAVKSSKVEKQQIKQKAPEKGRINLSDYGI